MSTGRAITCDQCNKIHPFSDEDWRTLEIPSGWIRVSTREPRRWNWTSKPNAPEYVAFGDFCSVSCLTSWTYDIPFADE